MSTTHIYSEKIMESAAAIGAAAVSSGPLYQTTANLEMLISRLSYTEQILVNKVLKDIRQKQCRHRLPISHSPQFRAFATPVVNNRTKACSGKTTTPITGRARETPEPGFLSPPTKKKGLRRHLREVKRPVKHKRDSVLAEYTREDNSADQYLQQSEHKVNDINDPTDYIVKRYIGSDNEKPVTDCIPRGINEFSFRVAKNEDIEKVKDIVPSKDKPSDVSRLNSCQGNELHVKDKLVGTNERNDSDESNAKKTTSVISSSPVKMKVEQTICPFASAGKGSFVFIRHANSCQTCSPYAESISSNHPMKSELAQVSRTMQLSEAKRLSLTAVMVRDNKSVDFREIKRSSLRKVSISKWKDAENRNGQKKLESAARKRDKKKQTKPVSEKNRNTLANSNWGECEGINKKVSEVSRKTKRVVITSPTFSLTSDSTSSRDTQTCSSCSPCSEFSDLPENEQTLSVGSSPIFESAATLSDLPEVDNALALTSTHSESVLSVIDLSACTSSWSTKWSAMHSATYLSSVIASTASELNDVTNVTTYSWSMDPSSFENIDKSTTLELPDYVSSNNDMSKSSLSDFSSNTTAPSLPWDTPITTGTKLLLGTKKLSIPKKLKRRHDIKTTQTSDCGRSMQPRQSGSSRKADKSDDKVDETSTDNGTDDDGGIVFEISFPTKTDVHQNRSLCNIDRVEGINKSRYGDNVEENKAPEVGDKNDIDDDDIIFGGSVNQTKTGIIVRRCMLDRTEDLAKSQCDGADIVSESNEDDNIAFGGDVNQVKTAESLVPDTKAYPSISNHEDSDDIVYTSHSAPSLYQTSRLLGHSDKDLNGNDDIVCTTQSATSVFKSPRLLGHSGSDYNGNKDSVYTTQSAPSVCITSRAAGHSDNEHNDYDIIVYTTQSAPSVFKTQRSLRHRGSNHNDYADIVNTTQFATSVFKTPRPLCHQGRNHNDNDDIVYTTQSEPSVYQTPRPLGHRGGNHNYNGEIMYTSQSEPSVYQTPRPLGHRDSNHNYNGDIVYTTQSEPSVYTTPRHLSHSGNNHNDTEDNVYTANLSPSVFLTPRPLRHFGSESGMNASPRYSGDEQAESGIDDDDNDGATVF